MGAVGVAVFESMQGEALLVERHRQGDRSAFLEVMAAHKDAVYGYLVRCRVGPGERDDLAQEIFMRVHRALHRFVPERPLKAWIFTIAANVVRSHFRARKQPEGSDVDTLPLAGPGPSGENALERKETAQWLEAMIAALPRSERDVLILSCVEGLEQDEVAMALSMPVNTVKTHLRRARLRMAEALKRRSAIAAREERR